MKRLIPLASLFLFACNSHQDRNLSQQRKKQINSDFVGYWSMEGFRTKMFIYKKKDSLHATVIDWAYCEELVTLDLEIIDERKILISTQVPSNNHTTISFLELINSNKLREQIKGNSTGTAYWNRIR